MRDFPGCQDHIWGVPKANVLLVQKDPRINNSHVIRWKLKNSISYT
jgi:hypothetical protein